MTWRPANCAERAFSKRRQVFAALDLGTNNCRLMVAAPKKHQSFSVVTSYSRIVRLGEGLAQTGRLSEAAQARAIEALKACAEIIARWDVSNIRCVTTEACRMASNGDAFIDRVRAETGLSLDVIDAEREAALAVAGCSALVDPAARRVIVFDIGGGSTELSWVNVDRSDPGKPPRLTTEAVLSLPFGVVRLSDGLKPGSFAGDHYRGIKSRVVDAIRSFPAFDPGENIEGAHLIGTSGTATSIAAIQKGLKRYRRREIDGMWLSRRDVSKVVDRLQAMGLEGRKAEPCIGEGRADLIMPGCAILEGIIEATGFHRLRVADRGLREGIITELLAENRQRAESSTPAASTAAQPAE